MTRGARRLHRSVLRVGSPRVLALPLLRVLGFPLAMLVGSIGWGPGGLSSATAQVILPALTTYLRVDFAAESKGGRMRLTGYVYNTWDKWATDVRLLVEALDASGHAVGSMPVSVYGKVPPGGRSYWDVPLAVSGSSYRVTVQSADWRTYGAGGG